MTQAESISIQVAYASAERQRVVDLRVAPGVTAREAVRLSGIAAFFPGLDAEHCPIGIFGRVVPDDRQLRQGDRIEIYRPLLNDPREARRERVLVTPKRRS